MKRPILLSTVVFICLLFGKTIIHSCTGITLKSLDGSWIFGRTLEWGGPVLDSDVLIVPRGYRFIGSTPEGKNGLQWTSKYGFTGMNFKGAPNWVIDGVNEKGLKAGAFYFSPTAKYEPYNKNFAKKTLAPIEFIPWILSNFATIKEVKNGLNSVKIAPVVFKQWEKFLKEFGGVLPLHFFVMDSTGKAIAIEPINGKLKVFDNPIGVLTNAPSFDWHIINLSNYVHLSPLDAPAKVFDGLVIKEYGEGSGMEGLPGNFTAPARFVRATTFAKSAQPGKNSEETVRQVFHILNQFDIPEGTVRTLVKKKVIGHNTPWTSVADTRNLIYHFHTANNRQIRMVDLNKADLNAKNIVTIPGTSVTGKFVDLTPKK